MLQNIRFFVYFSFAVNSVSDVLYIIICPHLSVHCPLSTVHSFLSINHYSFLRILLKPMNKSARLGGADVTGDDAVFADDEIGVYLLALVSGVIGHLISIPRDGFALVFGKVESLRLLELVVTRKNAVEIVGQSQLDALDRLARDLVAKLREKRDPVLVRFDPLVADRGGGVAVALRLICGNEKNKCSQRACGE